MVDRETGKAIEQFQVTRGAYSDPSLQNLKWELSNRRKPSKGGVFSYTEQLACPGYAVRIEAPGYLPEERLGFQLGPEEVEFDVQLTPAENIKVVVTDQKGSPVAKAKAHLIFNGANPSIYNGVVSARPGWFLEATSNTDGSLEFPPQSRPYSILVLTESGYAELDHSRIEVENKVVLTGWGKLNGSLFLNGKPVADETISIRLRSNNTTRTLSSHFSNYLRTDIDGKFSYDRVPEGEIMISHQVYRPQENGELRLVRTLEESVEIVEGETATVKLDGEIAK